MTTPTLPQVGVSDLREVTIPNWKRFNPRPDRANFSWFRMENEFFHDQRIFILTNEQKLIYLFILCQASKKNTETVKISANYVSAVIRIGVQDVELCFKYLAQLELINMTDLHTPVNPLRSKAGITPAESRHDAGIEPSKSLTTIRNVTKRDETRRKNNNAGIRQEYSEDFEAVWVLYGRKGDKKRAFQEWGNLSLSAEERLNLQKAIPHYFQSKPERQFRKDLERFLKTDWRIWVNPDPAMLNPLNTNGNGIHPPRGNKITQAQSLLEHNMRQAAEFLASKQQKKEHS